MLYYPEKHIEAPSFDSDIHFLKKKLMQVLIISLPRCFLIIKSFLTFKKCMENKINVPIIPGLKPISTKKQQNVLPQRFYVDLPDDLIKSVIKCKNNDRLDKLELNGVLNKVKN